MRTLSYPSIQLQQQDTVDLILRRYIQGTSFHPDPALASFQAISGRRHNKTRFLLHSYTYT